MHIRLNHTLTFTRTHLEKKSLCKAVTASGYKAHLKVKYPEPIMIYSLYLFYLFPHRSHLRVEFLSSRSSVDKQICTAHVEVKYFKTVNYISIIHLTLIL